MQVGISPQDAEAVLGIVEGDPLDQPGQDLPVRDLSLPAGAGFHDVPSAGAVSRTFARRALWPASARHRNPHGTTKGNLLIRDTPPVGMYVLNMFCMRGLRLWGSRLHRACAV